MNFENELRTNPIFKNEKNVGETGAFLAIFVKVNFRSNYVRI